MNDEFEVGAGLVDGDFDAGDLDGNGAKAKSEVDLRAFDPSLRKRAEAFQRELEAAFARAEADVRARHTGQFDDLCVASKPKVSRRASAERFPMMNALIDRILTVDGASSSQTAIRDQIQQRFPCTAVPKDWTRALPQWAIARLRSRVSTSGPALASLRPVNGWTLARLHRETKAAFELRDNGHLSARVSVSLTADAVLINGSRFTISTNKSNGKSYRTVRVRVDHLREALVHEGR